MNMYRNEDDYWNALGDAHKRAEREAMESAEMSADLYEFETDTERDAYVDEYFNAEYERLCQAYEKAL